jgi:hypothetical protein
MITTQNPSFTELFRSGLPSGRAVLIVRCNLPETDEYRAALRSQLFSYSSAERTPMGRTYGAKPHGMPAPEVRGMLWDGNLQRKYWSEFSALKLLLWQDNSKEL